MYDSMGNGGSDLGRRRHGQRGQALSEFAIALGVFVLLVGSVVELGRAWSAAGMLTAAVRDAARLAAITTVDKRSAVVKSQIESAAGAYFPPAKLTVQITTSNAGGQPLVTVTATGELDVLLSGWLGFGKTFSVSREATMRDETVMS